jgi:ATP-dependent Zn protease
LEDHNDEWPDLAVDAPRTSRPLSRLRRVKEDDAIDAQALLATALIESACSKAELKDIAERAAFCLLVQVPAYNWVQPLAQHLRSLGEWEETIARTAPAKGKVMEDAAHAVVGAMASGGRVFGVTPTLATLPPAMVSGADQTIILNQITGDIIATVIKGVTGDLPIDVPKRLGAGLNFDEIAACLRPGSTSAECILRLQRASATKNKPQNDESTPRFEALSGYGAAMTWGLELIEDLEAWRRGEIPWSALSASVILSSAPGLGKTSMVKSLAKSAGVPMVATSVAAWFSHGSGYLDDIIRQIDTVFAQAKALSPCLLLLDEIDAVPSRFTVSSKHADYWSVVIGHLLTLLDGATSDSTEGIILVGATNLAHRLDPALVRPGRFSTTVHIDPPDAEALLGILRQHLGKDLQKDDITEAAQLAGGSSGAMVVEWVKIARRTARTAKRPMILADLVAAIAPPDQRADDYIERVAIHEAGHAVVAHAMGLAKVLNISIVQRGSTAGSVETDNDGRLTTKAAVEADVVQTLAGRAAEEVILAGVSLGSGCNPRSDLARATSDIGMLHLSAGMGATLIYQSDPEDILGALSRNPRVAAAVEADLRRLYAEAIRLVRIHADVIVAVAEELMDHRHIGAEQFLEIVDSIKAPRQWAEPTQEIHHG